jgi:hypothetical protein
MSEDEIVMPATPPPLGPGDDDPRSPTKVSSSPAFAPLGPGDDDPRSPAKGAPVTTASPLGPGERAEPADDDLEMICPPPAGPGDAAQSPRNVTHRLKRQPTPSTPPINPEPVDETVAAEPSKTSTSE